MTRTTATEAFFSKSDSAKSVRWKVDIADAQIPRCYVFDSSYQHTPSRWNVLWLEHGPESGKLFVNVTAGGIGAAFTLEPDEVKTFVLSQTPLLRAEITATDPVEARERFERIASLIMHDMLTPVASNYAKFSQLAMVTPG